MQCLCLSECFFIVACVVRCGCCLVGSDRLSDVSSLSDRLAEHCYDQPQPPGTTHRSAIITAATAAAAATTIKWYQFTVSQR